MKSRINGYAMAIKILSAFSGIIAFLIGFTTSNYLLAIGSIISAIFICAFGEIIQLLEDIKNQNQN